MDGRLTLHLRITGQVQGVGYRHWATREAARLRLAGWVRNRADGSVEVLVSGETAAVESFVERARGGPVSARVSNIERAPAPPPAHPGFQALPTF